MDHLEFIVRVMSHIPDKGQVKEASAGCFMPIRASDVVFRD